MSDYVLLKDLAREFGIDRSVARRYVLKQGFEPIKVRPPGSLGQLTLALTLEDAEAVKELRQNQGYDTKQGQGRPVFDDGDGWFYIIQLVPELEVGRVKLGFASDVNARLSAHKTAAPTAKLLKTWPCNRKWEHAAIASVTRIDCAPLSGEVFVVKNLDDLIGQGDAFFSIMPEIQQE